MGVLISPPPVISLPTKHSDKAAVIELKGRFKEEDWGRWGEN